MTAEELVSRYGPGTKYMVVDIYEIVRNINTVQEEINELKRRLERSCSGIELNGEECSSVSCDTPETTIEGGMKLPVTVAEWEFPSCSEGDDDVFYEGEGTDENPIEID